MRSHKEIQKHLRRLNHVEQGLLMTIGALVLLELLLFDSVIPLALIIAIPCIAIALMLSVMLIESRINQTVTELDAVEGN